MEDEGYPTVQNPYSTKPLQKIYCYSLNKDHQKMMVDPIFLIVQNVRSFLTAVTPTAVTPTAVILFEFT